MATKLKAEYKKAITEDFAFAAKMMKENVPFDAKLFYFSSTFGTVSRILNAAFDSHLALIYMLLTTVHSNVLGRVVAMKGGEQSFPLKEDFFDRLGAEIEELAARLKNDADTGDVLEKIALLAFATTGNGYYLLQKGMFTI
jgi:hypothetical protein